MVVRQTSLNVYDDLMAESELGRRQKVVFESVKRLGEATDLELADFLGKRDPNFVRPRRNELFKLGLVVCSGKRECKVSGRTAMVWRPT